MIGMPPVGVKLGVNCNMCVGKSVTSSDATPAIMQSQASHDLRFWCSRCKNQFVVSLTALHLYLHLHPDWLWLTDKKMVDAALHWPSPFRLASRIELWHLLATRLCSTSQGQHVRLDAFVVLVTKEANATQRAPAKLDSLVRFRDEHVPFGHIHSGTSEFCWHPFLKHRIGEAICGVCLDCAQWRHVTPSLQGLQ